MHQPKIVSVVSNGDTLFPHLEAVRPTISQRELLRRATAARDAQEAQIAADRRVRAARIIGAPMATRVYAGRSALVTAASVALVAGCVALALALWLGAL